jgi:hypothetical protein
LRTYCQHLTDFSPVSEELVAYIFRAELLKLEAAYSSRTLAYSQNAAQQPRRSPFIGLKKVLYFYFIIFGYCGRY